ncbi:MULTISPECIES: MarR family winged helix-turn-helix transcriptional regulator [Shouchella]|jgi:DNA-binding MarR family transcriptional regulator|uniref:MarR family transcriptional regulator n=1 Tax=Shouchella clausii TaxID=79880 RepID=A0A268P1Q6_SHOCL|nr:MarR family transcriptional regulator [Shouchella clausii]MBU3232466.1 MarR family transcriptional regulator [Shouchella clausii]MBU3265844.1 MarR family transcriptional regulator [Shouchella clausii]MBU3505966.1 MarR family transcriptional regulator [Shouchella clausii]MBU3535848.1 MarR family transcriptional regulator [Shouchella clausii]
MEVQRLEKPYDNNRHQFEEIERSLRKIADLVKQKGREILAHFPITTPQFVALQWLNEYGDMTIGELSNHMHLACSTTTDLVDRMEKNGLVMRVKDKQDRRVVRIHLLDRGQTIIREVIAKRQHYLAEMLEHFTSEQVNDLEENLNFLLKTMKEKREVRS